VGEVVSSTRYGRYAGLLGAIVLLGLIAHSIFDSSTDPTGIPAGHMLAPFAVPLALGRLNGDADIATHADEGESGKVPACAERGVQILNVCQLYERGPLVLAMFVDSGSCASVLGRLQALAPSFPEVRFAAIAIRGERASLRRLIHRHDVRLPVGIDSDGAVAALYKVFTCPQINFAYRGGTVQSKALLGEASLASLRARVSALVAAQRRRERREPAA
jgi:AhpC/TSA family